MLPTSMQVAAASPPARPALGQEEPFAERVLHSFFPYRQGPPHVTGITAGTALAPGNWQLAQDVLPPEILNAVRDGELTILVQDTSDLPVSPEYINATIEHASDVSLDKTGNLAKYQAGLPFPLLDPTDPYAGLKAAWNARYADKGDAVQRWESLQVRNNAGEYKYGFPFFYAQAYGMHRARPERNIASWEEEGILYKEFMQVFLPVPASFHPHLGLVHLRYWHDQDTRLVGQWYITDTLEHFPRRRSGLLYVLAYDPEASAWRFPLLYEDLIGTYIYTYQWRLVSAQVALVPGFVHGTAPLFGGQRAGYPLDPWELRTVYVVEAVPRRAEHPYGRKVFFFDQQTFAPLCVLIYDRQGKHWRTGFFIYAHPDSYPGSNEVQVPILIGRSWIDYMVDQATVALVDEAIYNKPLSPDFFTLANMMRKAK
ncbi:MAG TPA: DUF1329 domain-containing protein [Candidatus Binatia bacterium]|nr:DUF1329 domain-containing protein [Candidatus Binatia bacterium]